MAEGAEVEILTHYGRQMVESAHRRELGAEHPSS